MYEKPKSKCKIITSHYLLYLPSNIQLSFGFKTIRNIKSLTLFSTISMIHWPKSPILWLVWIMLCRTHKYLIMKCWLYALNLISKQTLLLPGKNFVKSLTSCAASVQPNQYLALSEWTKSLPELVAWWPGVSVFFSSCVKMIPKQDFCLHVLTVIRSCLIL